MKKIILSLFTILAVGVVAIGATVANFSDTETSSNNTFTAGSLDLKTNDIDGTTASYTLTNLKPGAWDLAGQVVLKNAGTITGKAWYEITNVRNVENGCLEVETGDATCETTPDQGELGSFAKASLQANIAPWTRYPSAGLTNINAAAGVRYDIEELSAGETLPVVLYGVWTPGANDNVAQGDSVTFDIVFHLDQI